VIHQGHHGGKLYETATAPHASPLAKSREADAALYGLRF
jgi:hypothetical protein